MRLYEQVVLSRPDISPQQAEELVTEITGMVENLSGKVGKTEYWGLRSLSYPIEKLKKAHYSLINIEMPAAAVAELERRMAIHDSILRVKTYKVDSHDDEPSAMLSRKGGSDERRPRRDRD